MPDKSLEPNKEQKRRLNDVNEFENLGESNYKRRQTSDHR
jgi:hypothetical protein